MNRLLSYLALFLVVLAAVSSIILLASDSIAGIAPNRWAAPISALPLLAAGTSFLMAQRAIRPRSAELLKNLLLAATFLLWGAVQLMMQGSLSKRLGDLVIALYVIDLSWTILAELKRRGKSLD